MQETLNLFPRGAALEVVLQKLLKVRKAPWKKVFLCNQSKDLVDEEDRFFDDSSSNSFSITVVVKLKRDESAFDSDGIVLVPGVRVATKTNGTTVVDRMRSKGEHERY
jgi:hypothetical protein